MLAIIICLSFPLLVYAAHPDIPIFNGRAQCVMHPNPSLRGQPQYQNLQGTVYVFQQNINSPLCFDLHLQGFTKLGPHGFHVHESGNISHNCEGAGGHFNPFHKQHGSLTSHNRHAGDLGNIIISPTGFVVTRIEDVKMQMSLRRGPLNIVGRTIMVHEKLDDLGLGGNAESLKTGNAGKRLACCVIKCLDYVCNN